MISSNEMCVNEFEEKTKDSVDFFSLTTKSTKTKKTKPIKKKYKCFCIRCNNEFVTNKISFIEESINGVQYARIKCPVCKVKKRIKIVLEE
jgi:hypothetical protein